MKEPSTLLPIKRLRSSFAQKEIEAGCDEAGRGCLAGPVFAASVILHKDFYHPLLNDSKQLNAEQRSELRTIIEAEAIAWKVSSNDVKKIDEINILNASFDAMHQAIHGLETKPELLLIDGNYFPPIFNMPHHCIVKGDGKFQSIAAASILAKTHRDEYMEQLDQAYPQYLWKKNKGYGTREHRSAILKYGFSPHHRTSFHCKNLDLNNEC